MDLTLDVEDYKLNVRAAGVIIHNGKILVHRNVNIDHYALIGGEIIGYVATIENFFEMKGAKYHEIMFVHRVEFVDDEDKKIEYTLKNVEGKDYLQYEWLDLNNIEDYPLLPVAVKEILRDGEFPVHWINDDLNS